MTACDREIPGFVPTYDLPPLPGWRIVSTVTDFMFRVVRLDHREGQANRGVLMRAVPGCQRWWRLDDVEASVISGRFLVYRPRRRGEVPEGNREVVMAVGSEGEGEELKAPPMFAEGAKKAADPNAEFIPEHLRREFPVTKEDVWEEATEESLALAQAGYFQTLDAVDVTSAEKAEAMRPFEETLKTLRGTLKKTREYIQQKGEMVKRDVLVEVRGSVAIVFDPDTGEEIKRRTATDGDRNLWNTRGRGR